MYSIRGVTLEIVGKRYSDVLYSWSYPGNSGLQYL